MQAAVSGASSGGAGASGPSAAAAEKRKWSEISRDEVCCFLLQCRSTTTVSFV